MTRRTQDGGSTDANDANGGAPTGTQTAGAAGEEPFEACLTRLEALVDRLEEGELPLEEALGAFEEGVALTRRCAAQLERAERRIAVLVKQGRELVERPFEPGDEGD